MQDKDVEVRVVIVGSIGCSECPDHKICPVIIKGQDNSGHVCTSVIVLGSKIKMPQGYITKLLHRYFPPKGSSYEVFLPKGAVPAREMEAAIKDDVLMAIQEYGKITDKNGKLINIDMDKGLQELIKKGYTAPELWQPKQIIIDPETGQKITKEKLELFKNDPKRLQKYLSSLPPIKQK